MSNWLPCDACAGTGQIEQPTIREKIARHLVYAAAHPEQQFGLGLAPDEITELARELGILEPAGSVPGPQPAAAAPAIPPGQSFPDSAYVGPPADPALADRLGVPAWNPFQPAAEATPEPAAPADAIHDGDPDLDEDPPYFPPEPGRPNGVPIGTPLDLPGHVRIEPVEQPWRPVGAQQVAAPGIPGPATPQAPGAAGASLTGPPGGY